MEVKSLLLLSQAVGFVLLASVLQVNGTPVTFQNKPPMCPYGKCYIDRCGRICSCVPNEGNTTCTKDYEMPMECIKPPSQDKCPLGKKYKNPLWNDRFICYCNDDSSQTYECFDLSNQTPAEAYELLNSSRRSRNKAPQGKL